MFMMMNLSKYGTKKKVKYSDYYSKNKRQRNSLRK